MLEALAYVNLLLGLGVTAGYITNFIRCNKQRCALKSDDNLCSLFFILVVTSVILCGWYITVIFIGSESLPIVARLNTTLLLINAIVLSHLIRARGVN